MQLNVASGPHTLDQLQSALDELWRVNPHVPSLTQVQVAMAVTEIAANIIEHARASDFHVAIQVRPHEIEVDFTDTGRPAEIDLRCVRMPDEMAERGRGLAITQILVRKLSYFTDSRGNHWNLLSKEF